MFSSGQASWFAVAALIVAFAPMWTVVLWVASTDGPIERPIGAKRKLGIIAFVAALLIVAVGVLLVALEIGGPTRPGIKDLAANVTLAQTLLIGAVVLVAAQRRRARPTPPAAVAREASPRQVGVALAIWLLVALSLLAIALGPLDGAPGVDLLWRAFGVAVAVPGVLSVVLALTIRQSRHEHRRRSQGF